MGVNSKKRIVGLSLVSMIAVGGLTTMATAAVADPGTTADAPATPTPSPTPTATTNGGNQPWG